MVSGVTYYSEIRGNIEFVGAIIEQNKKRKSLNYKTLQKWSNNILLVFYIGMFLILSNIVVFYCMPIFIYLWTGERELILELHMPGVDADTISGFSITTAMHMWAILIAGVGTAGSDMLFLILILYTQPLSELFVNAIERLDKHLTTPNYDQKKIKMELRNIFLMHQELTRYGFFFKSD